MKAVLFRAHGGPDKLSYEDIPTPVIGPDEVLVKVKACALNHLDIWIRQGNPAYPMPMPHVSGSDVAGVVEQVGAQADHVTVGQRVFISPGISCWKCEQCLAGRDNFCRSYSLLGAMMHGGYAEYVKVPFRNVLPIPENLSFEQAAAFPLVSVTASHMLFGQAGLQHGETVLIMGGGSGVGTMAIQLAKLAGARVITTVGSDDKIPKAVVLGADAVSSRSREAADRRPWRRCGHRTYRAGGVGELSGFPDERRPIDYLRGDDRRRGEGGSPVYLFPPVHDQGLLHGDQGGTGKGSGADGPEAADFCDRPDVSVAGGEGGAGADALAQVLRQDCTDSVRMLKTLPNGVLSRRSPCDVPQRVRLSRPTPCGLAREKARLGAPGLGG